MNRPSSRQIPWLLIWASALALPGLALPAVSPASAAPAAKPAPATLSPAQWRERLTLQINAERARAGVPPLAPSEPLQKVAQQRAEEIAARRSLPGEQESFALFNQVQIRLVKAGYKAHGWTESITVTAGGVDDVIAYWKEDSSYSQAMGRDYQDVGIGLASFDGVPLYTFVFAWPRSEFYARQTAELGDAAQIRRAMLARVNAEREKEGLPPLVADPRLDLAAQKHAEDMLARIYYSHETPEGAAPRQRLQAAGFLADAVGENIAAGHFSVDTAMNAWLHSSGHRRNILESRFTHLGVGIAVGGYEHRYQVLWVQDFGRPSPGTAGGTLGGMVSPPDADPRP
jgi:uncharacterized protein YkwD